MSECSGITVRGDFRSESDLLQRVWLLGAEFDRFDLEDWSHYRNREDFDRVYSLEQSAVTAFEQLYRVGRDCARGMGWWLKSFNEVREFPTLNDFVRRFEGGWVDQTDSLINVLAEARKQASLVHAPFAVTMMIGVFEKQMKMLAGVRTTLDMLAKSDLCILERGGSNVKNEGGAIHISNVGGNARVNIQSTDNSINKTDLNFSATFDPIKNAIEKADIIEEEKATMLESLGKLEGSAGSEAFTDRYKEFVSTCANHTTILAPFIPALALLL